MKKLPIKAQGVIYKINSDGSKSVLCLKRSPEDGGFWHILTGTLEQDESLTGCLLREIKEELGVNYVKLISGELHRFLWEKNGVPIWVFTYAVEIEDVPIVLNQEHIEYKWLSPDLAYDLVETDSAKEILSVFQTHMC